MTTQETKTVEPVIGSTKQKEEATMNRQPEVRSQKSEVRSRRSVMGKHRFFSLCFHSSIRPSFLNTPFTLLPVLLAALLFGAQSAQAGVWSGASSGTAYVSGGTGDYDYTGNWVGASIGDSFSGFTLTGDLTVTLDANRASTSGLNLDYDGAFNLTLTGITLARTLTLGGNVSADTVVGNRTITIGGGTTVLLNLGTVNRNFTVGAGDTLVIANAIANTVGGIIKLGTGILQLNAANLYTGLTQVEGGELKWGVSNALSTGGLTINNSGTVNMGVYTDAVGTVTLNAGGTIKGTTGRLTTGSGGLVSSGGTITDFTTGGVTLGGPLTYATNGTETTLVIYGAFDGGASRI